MVKSVVLEVFEVIIVLILSLMAWSITIGLYESGYDSPSMFNNYSVFKEYVWGTAERAYIDRYALYSEDSGAQFYQRTASTWNSAASTEGVGTITDSRSTCIMS